MEIYPSLLLFLVHPRRWFEVKHEMRLALVETVL